VSGTTLLESVIALGLLAGLLISAAGLLGQAQRQILGGAHLSQALALTRTVLEDLELLPYDGLVQTLGCDASVPRCLVISGDPAVAAWQRLAELDLPLPAIEIDLRAPSGVSLVEASALRVTVRVSWLEGQRRRRLQLTTWRV